MNIFWKRKRPCFPNWKYEKKWRKRWTIRGKNGQITTAEGVRDRFLEKKKATLLQRGRLTARLQREADRELKKITSSGEMKSDCIRIYIVRKVLNVAINPFRAAFFFLRARNTYVVRKLKKIAYVSLLGEMKSECIRIYVVRKVLNVAIRAPSELCGFFFEIKERLAQKLKRLHTFHSQGNLQKKKRKMDHLSFRY